MRHTTALIASLLLAQSLAAQTTWYVDGSAAPGGNGSAGAPFNTIPGAFAAAVNGDTILVAPGTYASFGLVGKDVTLKSAQGAAVTTIGYTTGVPALSVYTTSSACVIDGFTITGGQGLNYISCFGFGGTPGGVDIQNASPYVTSCIIRNNVGGTTYAPGSCATSFASATVGGVAVRGTNSQPVFENCVIAANTGGTGILFWSGTQQVGTPGGVGGVQVYPFQNNAAVLRNCTITGNSGGPPGSHWASSRGGIEGFATLENTIVYGNAPGVPTSWLNTPTAEEIGAVAGTQPQATWSDIRGGFPGIGNFNANPMLVNPSAFDYRLSNGSPCIDAGTLNALTSDLEGVARPQYLQNDVGAYEWRPPLALSFAIAQPAGAASVSVMTSGGSAGEVYVNLFTVEPTNGGPLAGTGPWGGLLMAATDVATQVGFGAPPYVGVLGAGGSAATTILLPPGLTGVVVYAVSHTLGASHVSRRSPVVAYTLL